MIKDKQSQEPVLEADREHWTHLLHQMLRIRRMEEKCAELYQASKIRGFLHLYIGEEAVATGIMESLTPDDGMVTTYREHAHALLRGMKMGVIMAEMYGKLNGCCRGRGGSMHLFDGPTHLYGGNGIVASGIPLGVGLALAYKMQNLSSICCTFFGEGAMAEGDFHEAINLAALWQVPVLFICENNFYCMGTALKYHSSNTDLAAKAASYNVPSTAVDGMDVLAVDKATREAVDDIRAGKGPHFLEIQTYRFRAHSMFDAELYRSKAEVEEAKKRDPIQLFVGKMKEAGIFEDALLQGLEKEVAKEVEEAVAFAEASPWEPVEELTRFVYTERRPA